jgi:hypothetical protein
MTSRFIVSLLSAKNCCRNLVDMDGFTLKRMNKIIDDFICVPESECKGDAHLLGPSHIVLVRISIMIKDNSDNFIAYRTTLG